MEAAAILAIIDGALTILEKAAPSLEQAVNSGQVSNDVQQGNLDRLNALRLSTAFGGPEWRKSTDETTTTPNGVGGA